MEVVVLEIVWLVGSLKELNVEVIILIKVYLDSKAAILIAGNPMFHEITKHIQIDYHFIRDKVKSGFMDTQHLCTSTQLANILTKG